MSTYEAYDITAGHYDLSRQAEGLEIVLGCLATLGGGLDALSLLDAGCGTGNYSATLAPHLGKVTGLDMSAGMLAQAKSKLSPELTAGRAALHQGSITDMPFADGTFDAVIFNQVLHHLERGTDPDYGGHVAATREAFRVLRPGGMLLINACSHVQLKQSFWFYRLLPEGLEAVLARCVPASCLKEILGQAGFILRDRIVPLESVLQGESYFDPRGPLDPAWRKGDSIWSLVPPERIEAAEQEIRALDAADELESYLARQDAPRQDVGQFSFFSAVKP